MLVRGASELPVLSESPRPLLLQPCQLGIAVVITIAITVMAITATISVPLTRIRKSAASHATMARRRQPPQMLRHFKDTNFTFLRTILRLFEKTMS